MAYLTVFLSRVREVSAGDLMGPFGDRDTSACVTALEVGDHGMLSIHVDDVARGRQLAAALLQSCDDVERARSQPVELVAEDLEAVDGERAAYDAAASEAEAAGMAMAQAAAEAHGR